MSHAIEQTKAWMEVVVKMEDLLFRSEWTIDEASFSPVSICPKKLEQDAGSWNFQ